LWTSVLFWWAAVALLLNLLVAVVIARGSRAITSLGNLPEPQRNEWPRVSIVIPARNEARDVRAALQSVLLLDYPDYEVIAVNDRSTDETGDILEQFAAEQPRLRVVHISELPAGWLGKNHAMHVGAAQADGSLLLFTDADVVHDPPSLRRAVDFLLARQLDHLAMVPRVVMPSWLLQSFVVLFTNYFMAYFRPWKARDPKSAAHIGVGAFNLVRTGVYRDVHGHQPIAMRPDDDVRLGRLLKQQGYRQDVLDAIDMLHVPWYASVRELIRGLEKNAFAGVDYRLWVVVVSSLMALSGHLLPFLMVFVATGVTRWLFAGSIGVLLIWGWMTAGALRVPRSTALGLPLAVAMFLYIQWRTTLLTLMQGGIRWRDTFYSLRDLKQR
jgi:glycosyltransferase involved in cell wall biosynthesis